MVLDQGSAQSYPNFLYSLYRQRKTQSCQTFLLNKNIQWDLHGQIRQFVSSGF